MTLGLCSVESAVGSHWTFLIIYRALILCARGPKPVLAKPTQHVISFRKLN